MVKILSRINENGNEKFKTDNINCTIYKSPNNEYELATIDDKQFIIIKRDTNINILNDLPQYCFQTIFDEWNLINSLLSLYEKLPFSKYYEMLDKFYIQNDTIIKLVEKELSHKHITLILNWCKLYGLPFIGDSTIELGRTKSYKWFGFTNDFKSCIEYNICGFRIGCFLLGIHILYKTVIVGKSLKEINEYPDSNHNLNKETLETYIRKTTKSAQLHYEIGEHKTYIMYDLTLCAETSLSAAMYTVQLWICSPSDFIIKRCSKCNHHFLAKDPRSKYCGFPCTKDNSSKNITRSNVRKRENMQ